MTNKGKRGASAWQVAAVMFGVLFFMIALSTHTAAEITGTPPAQQIKAALLTSDLDTTEEPEQQTDENDLIETALLARAHKIENCTVTWYTNDTCEKSPDDAAYGITASGLPTVEHQTCAVDPAIIPLYSDVFVQYADGTIEQLWATDTGVSGAHVDIYTPEYGQAIQNGKQSLTVYYIPPTEVDEN
jgi:3D (Asp-Asp-Asp) domain-containing protein